jgi:hypothetical protein
MKELNKPTTSKHTNFSFVFCKRSKDFSKSLLSPMGICRPQPISPVALPVGRAPHSKQHYQMLPSCNNPLVLVTSREVRRTSNFAQIGIEYENGHMHMYIKGSPVEIHIQTQLNSKSSSKTAQQYSSATFASIK